MSATPAGEAATAAATLREQGYCLLPELYSLAVCQATLADIEALFDRALEGRQPAPPANADLDAKYLFLKERHPKLKSHGYDLLGRLDRVARLGALPRVLAVARALTGGEPLLVDRIQVRIDDASRDRDLPAHQELAQLSFLNYTLWLPLRDTGGEAGGIQVAPGSHRLGLLEHKYYQDKSGYHGVTEEVLARFPPQDVAVPAGTGVLFHNHLVHGSAPNRSPHIRWTVVGRFNDLGGTRYLRDPEATMYLPYEAADDEVR